MPGHNSSLKINTETQERRDGGRISRGRGAGAGKLGKGVSLPDPTTGGVKKV